MDIEVRRAGPGRWDDVAALFGDKGAADGCWCMWWRLSNQEFSASGPDGNRAALRSRLEAGEQVGLLGYAAGEPVGWCGVAPRPAYGRLPRTRALNLTELDNPAVWSVVCFFVKRELRRAGVASALLDAAVAHAREQGAKAVEGYPIPTEGRHTPAKISTGTVELFAQAGFVTHGSPGGRRVVMRRAL